MAPSKREFCHVLERVFGPTLAEFLVAMQRVTSGVVKQQTAIGIAKAVLEGLDARVPDEALHVEGEAGAHGADDVRRAALLPLDAVGEVPEEKVQIQVW